VTSPNTGSTHDGGRSAPTWPPGSQVAGDHSLIPRGLIADIRLLAALLVRRATRPRRPIRSPGSHSRVHGPHPQPAGPP
jgi:hypothetical protein